MKSIISNLNINMKYLFIIAAIVLNITNAMAQSIIIKAEPITPEYHGEELRNKI